MRVELIPSKYGNWDSLVTNKNTIIGYPDRQKFEIKYQVYGIATSKTKTEARRISPPEWGKEKAARLQKTDGFSFYKLAGSYPYPDLETPQLSMPIYYKGLNPIVDSFYPKFMKGWHQNSYAGTAGNIHGLPHASRTCYH